jgi:hypothetical protein
LRDLNGALLLSLGRADTQMRIAGAAFLLLLPLLFVLAPFGLIGIAAAFLVRGYVLLPVIALAAAWIARVEIAETVRRCWPGWSWAWWLSPSAFSSGTRCRGKQTSPPA